MWFDGSVFEGFFDNDMVQGQGRLIHSNGDYYIGEFKDNKAHGWGRYVHNNSEEEFEG